jgi:glycine/D-amino acid oxidase-like deaminating enzyme
MKHRIVVLGAGYAGAFAAGNLARRLSAADTEITVVNAVPDFVEPIRFTSSCHASGLYEVVVDGAVDVGEAYQQAAARELAEELGIHVLPRLLLTFVNRSGLRPHWLGVHEAAVPGTGAADPDQVAWHSRLTEPELQSALQKWRFTPDSHEVSCRYLASRTAQT